MSEHELRAKDVQAMFDAVDRAHAIGDDKFADPKEADRVVAAFKRTRNEAKRFVLVNGGERFLFQNWECLKLDNEAPYVSLGTAKMVNAVRLDNGELIQVGRDEEVIYLARSY